METAKFIIGLLVFLLPAIAELKKQYDKRRGRKEVERFRPLPVEKPAVSRPAVQKQQTPPRHKPAAPVMKPEEEGVRVTVDTPSAIGAIPEVSRAEPSTLTESQKDRLRDKIIWGEILARKF